MGLAGYDNWLESQADDYMTCKPRYNVFFGEYNCADCDREYCEHYDVLHYYNAEDED